MPHQPRRLAPLGQPALQPQVIKPPAPTKPTRVKSFIPTISLARHEVDPDEIAAYLGTEPDANTRSLVPQRKQ